MSITLAIASYKGGVGKTTLVSIIASTLCERFNKKVLIIDVDPQSNITEVFIPPREFEKLINISKSHGKVFSLEWIAGAGEPLIYSITNNLSILPSKPEYIGLAKFLMVPLERMQGLRKDLESKMEMYDYVILDLPPQMYGLIGPLIKIVDILVTPVTKTSFALSALYYLIRDIRGSPPHEKPPFIGAILTRFRRNEGMTIEIYRKRVKRIVEEAYQSLAMKWEFSDIMHPTFDTVFYAHPKLADIRALPMDKNDNVRMIRLVRGLLKYSPQILSFVEPLTKELEHRINIALNRK